jgi:hypothetical protein
MFFKEENIFTHARSQKLHQYVYCVPVNGRILFFHRNPELVEG